MTGAGLPFGKSRGWKARHDGAPKGQERNGDMNRKILEKHPGQSPAKDTG